MQNKFYQDLQVNVLDADTKEVIRNDFYVLCSCDGVVGYSPALRAISDGQAMFRNLDTSRSMSSMTIQFDVFGDQFTQIGYDPASITGNNLPVALIEGPEINVGWGPTQCDVALLPRVANIYVSKLK